MDKQVEKHSSILYMCTLEIISNRSKGMSLKTGKVAKNLHMSGATVSCFRTWTFYNTYLGISLAPLSLSLSFHTSLHTTFFNT